MSFGIVDLECKDHGYTKSLRPEGYHMQQYAGKLTTTHRIVYAEANGLDVHTMAGVVMHTCDNPRCIEPTHLVLGTRADNNKDRANKGRSAKSVPSRQRLSAEDVTAIKARWVKGTAPKPNPNGTLAIAREYGVDPAVITKVIKGTYLCRSA